MRGGFFSICVVRAYNLKGYGTGTFPLFRTLNPFVAKSIFWQRKSISLAVSRTEIDYQLIPVFRYFHSLLYSSPNRIS